MRHIWKLSAALVLASAIATSASAQPSGRLTVYTSQPSGQIAKVVEAFNKAHPKVQVSLYRSGTTEVMNRLQAEFAAGRPQADVVLVADAVATTQLKNDGRLLTYAKAPADKVPAALIDPDKTFFGTKLITTGIVYNTKLVSHRTDVVERPAGAGGGVEDDHGASALFRRRGDPCRHLRAAEGFRLAVFRDGWRRAAPSPPRATAR